MNQKTILLTSVGRRDYLIKYFKELQGYNCRILAANSIKDTTGMMFADESFVSPPIRSKEYIPFIIDICKRNNVDIIISLFDLDTLYLSHHRCEFDSIGVKTLFSEKEVIEICLDKIKMNKFLNANGFKTPNIFTDLDEALTAILEKRLDFPLVLKPQWGQGSLATEIVSTKDELIHAYHFLNSKVNHTNIVHIEDLNYKNLILIQEFISGDEYGVDIINDLKGNNVASIIKKKLAMRAGETDSAITIFDENIKSIVRNLGNKIAHIGMLDADLIKRDDEIFIIDLNPRFGGGYPFSHEAGANVPKAIMQWLDGKDADQDCFKYTEGMKTFKGISLVSSEKL